MRVWVAGQDELDAVAELMIGFRNHMGRDQPRDDLMRATAARIMSEPNAEYLLAAPDGDDEAAAVCQLRYRLSIWTGTEDCWLEDLFVSDRARRSGLGRALVEAAFDRARERGCGRVELDVDDDNEAAIALYESTGLSLESKPPGRNYLMGRRLP
ncbi:MAG TPA: GNAT family N-acetyltransferase [Thermoleophilaceae bacterium]|jgi:ribosomal protein S18 acetylase RimI-like enzyme|nr:GNAT family N-acetyltransferase [Thermoleophilaceae bacterium]